MTPPSAARRRSGAFALVLTLLILSVLTIVAVSYLASMTADRAAAAAFANRARAEEAARAGADAAMASLREHVRAFPDSVTVWDPAQSRNADGTFNEGTTLYLRARGTKAATDPDDRPDLSAGVDQRPPSVTPGAADDRHTFALPLVSGVLDDPANSTVHSPARPLASKQQTLPVLAKDAKGNPDNYADLNFRRFKGDTQGWIGSPPAAASATPSSPKPVRAPWVDLKTPNPDPAKPTEPVTTARYAFWVEDESFRANVNRAGFSDPAARRDNAKELALNAGDVNLFGTLAATLQSGAQGFGNSILQARNAFPGGLFPVPRAYAHNADDGGTTLPAAVDDSLRYLTTTTSAALNLSRHGSLRLNLNDAQRVLDPNASPDPAFPANVARMQQEVDRLVETLRFHAPDFGERFYRLTTAADAATLNARQVAENFTSATSSRTPHRNIYLYKVAANLHDYLDADSQPTMIKLDGTIYVPTPPESANTPSPGDPPRLQVGFGDPGENRIAAMGKESVPFLQEGGCRIRGRVTGTDYSLTLDYYVELWNMTDRPIKVADDPHLAGDPSAYLGSDAYLRIANQPGWLQDKSGNINNNNSSFPALTSNDLDNNTPPTEVPANSISLGVANARDLNILLGNALRGPSGVAGPVIFDPGVATVITTDPDWASAGTVANTANVFYCPLLQGPKNLPGKRTYNGKLDKNGAGEQADAIKLLFRKLASTDPNTQVGTDRSDYLTEILLGNNKGYLECFQQPIPIYNSSAVIDYRTGVAPVTRFSAGSLLGNNNSPSQLGDPRTNNEQLLFTLYASGGTAEPGQGRYFNETTTAQVTFGNPNNFLNPASPNAWPDYWDFPSGKSNPTAPTAPMVVANGPLTSIGQLGDIFDPARVGPSSGSLGIVGSRGGGRTFKIGQHDDRYDNSVPFPNSRGWAAWRLADFFATRGDVVQPGLVNINGLARDNGAALLAALNGFKFQPQTTTDPMVHGDAKLDGKSLGDTLPAVIDNLVKTRFRKAGAADPSPDPAKPGPFFERGELSEGLVSPTAFPPPPSLASGVSFAQVFDRGREEVFRRLAEMITTRGDVFTVYVMAQSGQPSVRDSKTFLPAATALLKVTFQLRPKNADNTDFDPGQTPFTFSHGNAAAAVAKRFAPPDHYDLVVLQASNSAQP